MRVAGVDRAHEGVGVETSGDVARSARRRAARRRAASRSCRSAVPGATRRVVARRERDDQRRQRLGEAVLVSRVLGEQHLARRRRAWRRPRRRPWHRGRRRGYARRRRAPWRRSGRCAVGSFEAVVVVLGEEAASSCHQITFASFRSFVDELGDRSDLLAGRAFGRLGRLQHLEARRHVDAESRPRSRRAASSCAFMMLGSEA